MISFIFHTLKKKIRTILRGWTIHWTVSLSQVFNQKCRPCTHLVHSAYVNACTGARTVLPNWPSQSLRTHSLPLWLRGLWSELITLSTSSCLLIRSALPYGPPRGSRQAGGQGWGKCWIPVGLWLHKLLLMREVLAERAASSNDHNGGNGWQMQP